ncbi:hypothetical protein J6590_038624 [Homalodisca vitripennis]|nr:hypothetical protein J6590_038624 [Homalodisca vitripennis]
MVHGGDVHNYQTQRKLQNSATQMRLSQGIPKQVDISLITQLSGRGSVKVKNEKMRLNLDKHNGSEARAQLQGVSSYNASLISTLLRPVLHNRVENITPRMMPGAQFNLVCPILGSQKRRSMCYTLIYCDISTASLSLGLNSYTF